MKESSTYILLLNWNGYIDTLECIESIILSYPDTYLVVVDNNSDDDSVKKICEYFEGRDIEYLTLKGEDSDMKMTDREYAKTVNVTLILNKMNYGFAGGNNVGLRYILSQGDARYVWMLNTDCVINEDTLPKLLEEAEADREVGFVGSVSRYYDNKDIIQCYGGGIHYPLLGVSRLYMRNININELNRPQHNPINYVMGVSLLVRTGVIKDVGLMVEDYFLYSEEVDWQYSAKKMGWKIAVADKSYVYHKDSASTRSRRHMFFYYINRASIMFNKKFYGMGVASISAFSLAAISVIRAWPNLHSIRYAFRGIKDGLKWQWKQ